MSVQPYQFDERLAAASTIPAAWYFDPAVLALEQTQVFGRTWQFIGRSEQVAQAGDYFTTVVAEEPLSYSVKRENGVHHFHGLLAHHLESSGLARRFGQALRPEVHPGCPTHEE